MKRKTRRTLEPDGRAGGDSGGLGLGSGVGEVELVAAELGVGDAGHWAVRVVVGGLADNRPVLYEEGQSMFYLDTWSLSHRGNLTVRDEVGEGVYETHGEHTSVDEREILTVSSHEGRKSEESSEGLHLVRRAVNRRFPVVDLPTKSTRSYTFRSRQH